MTRREKLIQRLLARPPEASFEDVRAVLELFGWRRGAQRGSHARFEKPGERPIIVPVSGGRKVKRTDLDMICERLGLEDDQ